MKREFNQHTNFMNKLASFIYAGTSHDKLILVHLVVLCRMSLFSHNNILIYAGTRRSHIAPFVSLISIGISRSLRPRAISHKAHLGAIYVFNFHYTNGEELASIIPRMLICAVDRLDPLSLICHFVVNLLLLVSKVFIMTILCEKSFGMRKKFSKLALVPI